MSRKPRERSASGVYHVMLRGINRQVIFEDNEDYEKFLQILGDCKTISCFKLYGYCLMSNHVHLLLRIGTEGELLEQIFKRVGVRYVAWYNHKYGRSGHLFQDRFRSEAVEDDGYLFTVLRYLHQNPINARLCKKPEQYRWSSYAEYLSGGGLCDSAELLAMLEANPARSTEAFRELHCDVTPCPCMDIDEAHRLTDAETRVFLLELCGTDKVSKLQALSLPHRDAAIVGLRERGASLRQIVRLTGWPFGIVRSR